MSAACICGSNNRKQTRLVGVCRDKRWFVPDVTYSSLAFAFFAFFGSENAPIALNLA